LNLAAGAYLTPRAQFLCGFVAFWLAMNHLAWGSNTFETHENHQPKQNIVNLTTTIMGLVAHHQSVLLEF